MIEGGAGPRWPRVVPSLKGHTLLLDVGANVDAKPNHLREFAVMGHFYAQMLFDIAEPRVGLLSIGERRRKGQRADEGDLPRLKRPVSTSSATLRGATSTTETPTSSSATVSSAMSFSKPPRPSASSFRRLRAELTRSWRRKIGAFLAKSAFDGLKKRIGLLRVRRRAAPRRQRRLHRLATAARMRKRSRTPSAGRNFAINRIDEKIRTKVNDLHKREHDSDVLATQ